ncbi:DUF5615 family PIN-like protein [Alienimonas sp. DA493]|uniref:DUF5615 family PIN-like protein n=1 Tax=Alienimonas sp. DA493 TaxID=3373605 RepID=UPI0037544043
MKFVVDEQLPPLLATRLNDWGHDALHVFDTPGGQSSADFDIRTFADAAERAVISKDDDFLKTHRAFGAPAVLLYVTTGNLRTNALLTLFETHLPDLVTALAADSFVNLGLDGPTAGTPSGEGE